MRPNQSSELMIARRTVATSPANPVAGDENEKARLRDLALARAARDDAAAFTEIFERHAPRFVVGFANAPETRR